MKVMLAIDHSEASEKVLDFAPKLISEEQHEVLVLTVQSPISRSGLAWSGVGIDPSFGMAGFARTGEALATGESPMDRAEELVEEALEEVDGDEALVEPGEVVTTIVDVANENEIDLIVVGSSGKGVLSRLLSRSVSHSLIDEAPCPVLVVT